MYRLVPVYEKLMPTFLTIGGIGACSARYNPQGINSELTLKRQIVNFEYTGPHLRLTQHTLVIARFCMGRCLFK
jgi:hypothetical protein